MIPIADVKDEMTEFVRGVLASICAKDRLAKVANDVRTCTIDVYRIPKSFPGETVARVVVWLVVSVPIRGHSEVFDWHFSIEDSVCLPESNAVPMRFAQALDSLAQLINEGTIS